ncbi:MAG TPA: hypothetical protein VG838_02730 [Opitutaceae bacterium]|nr:hypothetical protein [Opitutaceae bacterium]
MLSLLKKKKKPEEAAAAAAPQVPSWHPNFRNFGQLPDIKVVRTAFFVNGVAVFIALCISVFLGNREYELHSLRSQIAAYDVQIARDTAESEKAKALFKKFQEQEKRVYDVDAYMKSKPVVSEILLRLGETRPKNIALESIEIRAPETTPPTAPSIVLRAAVRGASDLASGEASAYVDVLKNDAVLGPKIDGPPEVTSSSRDVATGRLKIEITIHLKPLGKPPAAKKK